MPRLSPRPLPLVCLPSAISLPCDARSFFTYSAFIVYSLFVHSSGLRAHCFFILLRYCYYERRPVCFIEGIVYERNAEGTRKALSWQTNSALGTSALVKTWSSCFVVSVNIQRSVRWKHHDVTAMGANHLSYSSSVAASISFIWFRSHRGSSTFTSGPKARRVCASS